MTFGAFNYLVILIAGIITAHITSTTVLTSLILSRTPSRANPLLSTQGLRPGRKAILVVDLEAKKIEGRTTGEMIGMVSCLFIMLEGRGLSRESIGRLVRDVVHVNKSTCNAFQQSIHKGTGTTETTEKIVGTTGGQTRGEMEVVHVEMMEIGGMGGKMMAAGRTIVEGTMRTGPEIVCIAEEGERSYKMNRSKCQRYSEEHHSHSLFFVTAVKVWSTLAVTRTLGVIVMVVEVLMTITTSALEDNHVETFMTPSTTEKIGKTPLQTMQLHLINRTTEVARIDIMVRSASL